MERDWAVATYVVMAGAVVSAVASLVDGDTGTAIVSAFILVVAFFFNRAGGSGKGRPKRH